jgi:hypothetical protein
VIKRFVPNRASVPWSTEVDSSSVRRKLTLPRCSCLDRLRRTDPYYSHCIIPLSPSPMIPSMDKMKASYATCSTGRLDSQNSTRCIQELPVQCNLSILGTSIRNIEPSYRMIGKHCYCNCTRDCSLDYTLERGNRSIHILGNIRS